MKSIVTFAAAIAAIASIAFLVFIFVPRAMHAEFCPAWCNTSQLISGHADTAGRRPVFHCLGSPGAQPTDEW